MDTLCVLATQGLRANLKRSWELILSQEHIDACENTVPWQKLLFGLTFFHGVVQVLFDVVNMVSVVEVMNSCVWSVAPGATEVWLVGLEHHVRIQRLGFGDEH